LGERKKFRAKCGFNTAAALFLKLKAWVIPRRLGQVFKAFYEARAGHYSLLEGCIENHADKASAYWVDSPSP